MVKRHTNLRQTRASGGPYSRRYARSMRREASFAGQLIGGCLTVGAITFAFAPEIRSSWTMAALPTEKVEAVERSAYYPNCDAARAAGAAPIYRGSPGYREGMDGDGDGIACEPYH